MEFIIKQALSELQFGLAQSKAQFGICVNQSVPHELLEESRVQTFCYYQRRIIAKTRGCNYIQGDLIHLPFLTDSIDVIVVWHNLDFHEDIDKIIREFWRVLTPHGALLIIGANRQGWLPHPGSGESKHPLNRRSQINRILAGQGFAIEVEKTFGFLPKNMPKKLPKWLQSLEVIAQFCWPMLGSRYYIQARKPVLGFSEPLLVRKRKIILRPEEVVEPASRV